MPTRRPPACHRRRRQPPPPPPPATRLVAPPGRSLSFSVKTAPFNQAANRYPLYPKHLQTPATRPPCWASDSSSDPEAGLGQPRQPRQQHGAVGGPEKRKKKEKKKEKAHTLITSGDVGIASKAPPPNPETPLSQPPRKTPPIDRGVFCILYSGTRVFPVPRRPLTTFRATQPPPLLDRGEAVLLVGVLAPGMQCPVLNSTFPVIKGLTHWLPYVTYQHHNAS